MPQPRFLAHEKKGPEMLHVNGGALLREDSEAQASRGGVTPTRHSPDSLTSMAIIELYYNVVFSPSQYNCIAGSDQNPIWSVNVGGYMVLGFIVGSDHYAPP